MKALAVPAITLVALCGCAPMPPNTPGAGVGATYTPVIDTTGVNVSRYHSDLQACRSFSRQIDVSAAEMNGLIAGILYGAATGAAVGQNRRSMDYGARVGGSAGIGRAGSRAVNKQEIIMANCMASRGYRVLEGATIPAAANVPSPYLQADAAPQPVATPVLVAAPPQPIATPLPVATPVTQSTAQGAPPAQASPRFRPSACDWPGVTQGIGGC